MVWEGAGRRWGCACVGVSVCLRVRVSVCPCVRVCACPRVRVFAGVLPAGADVWLSVQRPPCRACQPVPGSAVSGVASWIAWIHSLGLEKSWEHAGGGSALLQGRPCCVSGGQVPQETASRRSHGARSRSRSPWRCRRKSSVSDSMSHPAQCRPHRAVIFILAEQTRQAARHSTCPPSLFSKVTGSVDPGRTSLQSPHVPHPSPPLQTSRPGFLSEAHGHQPQAGGTYAKNLGVCLSECGPWANSIGIRIAWGLVSKRRPRASARTRSHGQLGLP